jgi:DNA invertase Pin-like site-specific DNA recombinase
MKVAIYSRKSKFTGKGESIDNQIQICKDHIKYKYPGENIEFLEYEDEGFSGKNIDRPSFSKMMKDAKEKKFEVLICYRLDRIARNVGRFSDTVEVLMEKNITFISVTEDVNTNTIMGRAVMNISAVFAQMERETIAERVRDNMLELAKTGRWLGGQTPLGFKSEQIVYLDENFKERTMYKLSPLEEELKLVKLIYDKYIELKSLRQVTTYLLINNFKTKNNSNWNTKAVLGVLTSPTYVKANDKVKDYLTSLGVVCVGKMDNKHAILTYNKKKGTEFRNMSEWIAAVAKHEGIIDADIWLSIQDTLKDNKSKAPRLGKTNKAILTGLLRCGDCGSSMGIVHGPLRKDGTKLYYYSCTLKMNSKGIRCSSKNVNSNLIEKAVIDKIKTYAKDDSTLLKDLDKNLVKNTNNKVEINNLEKSIDDKKAAIKNLVNQLSQNSNSIASKYIIEEIEKLEKDIIEATKQLEEINFKNKEMENHKANIDLLKEYIKKFYEEIDNLDNEDKKKILNTLIDRIDWYSEENEINITLFGDTKKN